MKADAAPETFYDRTGTEVIEVPNHSWVVYKNNRQSGHYHENRPCVRCGGQGYAEAWRMTGSVCYRCAASTPRLPNRLFSDPTPEKISFYTLTRIEKLNKADDRRWARKEAKAAAQVAASLEEFGWIIDLIDDFAPHAKGKTTFFLQSIKETILKTQFLSEKQECVIYQVCERITRQIIDDAARENRFVGGIGIRMNRTLKSEAVIDLGLGQYGRKFINIFSDAQGNTFVYKGTSPIQKGDTLELRFTVKDHVEYKGTNQTIIQRIAAV